MVKEVRRVTGLVEREKRKPWRRSTSLTNIRPRPWPSGLVE